MDLREINVATELGHNSTIECFAGQGAGRFARSAVMSCALHRRGGCEQYFVRMCMCMHKINRLRLRQRLVVEVPVKPSGILMKESIHPDQQRAIFADISSRTAASVPRR